MLPQVPEENGQYLNPELVADSEGNLHAFWTYILPETEASNLGSVIYYSTWDGTGWSMPIDVIFTPGYGSAAGAMRPVIDDQGTLHMLWYGSSVDGHGIYYSRAHASNADSAASWRFPKMVLSLDRAPASIPHDMIIDRQGVLHVAGACTLFTALPAICYTRSSDGGNTWSNAILVSITEDMFAGYPRIAIGSDNTIHIVWLEFSIGIERYRRVVYSRLFDNGQEWQLPLEVTEFNNYLIPVIGMSEEGNIHIIWSGSLPVPGRHHIWSTDNGDTWTEPTNIMPVSGLGISDFAQDSIGTLHFVTSADGLGLITGLFHMQWEGNAWSSPIPISNSIIGEQPKAFISEGNILNVLWTSVDSNDQRFRDRLWFARRHVPAPHIAPHTLPTPLPNTAPTPIPNLAIEVNVKPSPETPSGLLDETAPSATRENPFTGIFWGILPAVVFVMTVLFLHKLSQNRV